MFSHRQKDGRGAESAVAKFLVSRGMTHLASNYFTRMGEVDLVMEDGRALVFVEVKKRINGAFGEGEDAVTPGKMRRIVHAAIGFVQSRGEWDREIRFDVVVLQDGRLRHYPSAFLPEPGLTYY